MVRLISLLILFLTYLSSYVDSCLVVSQECMCPPIQMIDQAGLRKNKYSSYLSKRTTVSPEVHVSPTCEITVSVSNMTDDNFYVMIFRDEAPPIFYRRYVSPSEKRLLTYVDRVTCVRDRTGDYVWEYSGGKMKNMSIALQTAECGCPRGFYQYELNVTNIFGTCDLFSIELSAGYPIVNMEPSIQKEPPYAIQNGDEITNARFATEYTCVSGNWYYNNVLFVLPVIRGWYDGSDLALNAFDYKYPCGCVDIFQLSTINRVLLEHFDYTHQFANYSISNVTVTYSGDNCTPNFTCSSSDEQLVVFSGNMDPVIYENGEQPAMQCDLTPLANLNIMNNASFRLFWFHEGVALTMPTVGCLKNTLPETTVCQCPEIRTIDRDGVRANRYGAYLGDRPTFAPRITVSQTCRVTVDVSEMEADDFYFMIFRDDAPPIFNRRFIYVSDKFLKFSPPNIACTRFGSDDYRWTYMDEAEGSEVRNMSFAMQSNEEQCGCDKWDTSTTDDDGMEVTLLWGTCDIHDIACPSDAPTGQMSPANGQLPVETFAPRILTEATCVNGDWYYNGVNMKTPSLKCVGGSYDWPCNCLQISLMNGNRPLLEQYDAANKFANFTIRNVGIEYSGANCSPSITCPKATDSLVLFTANLEPIIYDGGAAPILNCHKTPMSNFLNETVVLLYPEEILRFQRFWFLDGVALNSPALACLDDTPPPTPCECLYESLDESNIETLVGEHSFFPNVTSHVFRAPEDRCTDGSCPEQVECALNYTLVILDTVEVHLFPTGKLSAPQCSASTQNWTVDGGAVLSRLFAVCVDFQTAAPTDCACTHWELDEHTVSVVAAHPFYENVTSHGVHAPVGMCGVTPCPGQIQCSDGYTLVIFDENGAKVIESGKLTALSCSASTKKWTIDDGSAVTQLYSICVDYAGLDEGCQCEHGFLDAENMEDLVGNNSFYANITSYPFVTPLDSCENGDCPNQVICEEGYFLAVLDADDVHVFANGSTTGLQCSASTKNWTLENGAELGGLFSVCINYGMSPQCACSYWHLDEESASGVLKLHPFYQNVSGYARRAPEDTCSDATCPSQIECAQGYSLVVFQTDDDARVITSGILSDLRCSVSTKDWLLTDGTRMERLYSLCVDFSHPECQCEHQLLDESNIESLIGNHSFYSNVTSYPFRAPEDSCDNGACPEQIVCSEGYTLVVFDTETVELFPNGSTTGLQCSTSTKTWTLENGAVLGHLYSVCVDYSNTDCRCEHQLLDESNIEGLIGNHSFYSNVTSYPFRGPEDSCDNGECPEQVVCAPGYTLVVLDMETVELFPNGNTTGLQCSASTETWTLENGAVLNRLYSVCVNFQVFPQCACPHWNLDEAALENLVGSHAFYENVSSYEVRAPQEMCSLELCPVGVECSDGYTLVVFGTESVEVFPSGRLENSTCSVSTKSWLLDNGTQVDRLYSICVDYSRLKCQCSPISAVSSQEIGAHTTGNYLQNEQIWAPELGGNECNVTFSCSGQPGVDSYYTVLFHKTGVIHIDRVESNYSTWSSELAEPRLVQGLECANSSSGGNSSFQWHLYGAPLESVRAACVSDANSCKCPSINGSDALGAIAQVSERSRSADHCGLYEVNCPDPRRYSPKLISADLNPIPLLEGQQIDDLTCIQKTDGTFRWFFDSLELTEPAVSCALECVCGQLTRVDTLEDLQQYDKKKTFTSGYDISAGLWSHADCRDTVDIACPQDFDAVVIGANGDSVTGARDIRCVTNPLNSRSFVWIAGGRTIQNPALACLKKA